VIAASLSAVRPEVARTGLGQAAPGASFRHRVCIIAVEKFDEDDLVGGALGLGARQAADLHDASNLDLEGSALGRWLVLG
jgi:hypothetical protein